MAAALSLGVDVGASLAKLALRDAGGMRHELLPAAAVGRCPETDNVMAQTAR